MIRKYTMCNSFSVEKFYCGINFYAFANLSRLTDHDNKVPLVIIT